MSTATIESTQTVPSVKPVLPVVGEFGNGRLSPLMKECFNDLVGIFKLAEAKADKLARQIGSDYGKADARGEVSKKSVKVGKSNDDNKVTVKTAAMSIKGVICTPPLEILRTLKYIDESGNAGVLSRKTGWVLNETLTEYMDSL